MARKKPEVRMASYGIYSPFDRRSDELPKIREITTEVPAVPGTEFGYILQIRKARGEKITFRIEHPPLIGEDVDDPEKPFTGEQYIRSPDYQFFLGDCIWEPIENKVGDWTLTTWIADEQVAAKRFRIVRPA